MKSPHRQRPDDQARAETEKFIARYAGRPGTKPAGRRATGASKRTSGRAPASRRSRA
jgi:hypothetical protein